MTTENARVQLSQRDLETDSLANAVVREVRWGGDTRRQVGKLQDGTATYEGGYSVRYLERYASLAAAILAIGADNVQLVVSKATAVSADATIPRNIAVVVNNGGSFAVSAGVTLTINGPFKADAFRVFAAASTVVFGAGAVDRFYPEWWGGVGDGTTDDAPALVAMMAAAPVWSTIQCSSRRYRLGSTLYIPKPFHWVGTGINSCLFPDPGTAFHGIVIGNTKLVNYADCIAASTANVNISNPGTMTYDGVVMTVNQRLLLKNQTAPADNGIYLVGANSATALTRAADMNTGGEVVNGYQVYITSGTVSADKVGTISVSGAVTLGTTAITFTTSTALVDPNQPGEVRNMSMTNICILSTGSVLDVVRMKGVFESRFRNVHLNGASRYVLAMEACLQNRFEITITPNFSYPYSRTTANTASQVRILPKATIKGHGFVATNANEFWFGDLSGGTWTPGVSANFYQENQSGEGDNWIGGTIQGGTGGRAIEVYNSFGFLTARYHGENSGSILYSGCRSCSIGPGVTTNNIDLVDCDSTKIDGAEAQGDLSIDADCNLTGLGAISFNGGGINNLSASTVSLTGGRNASNLQLAWAAYNPSDALNICWNGDFRRWRSASQPDGYNNATGSCTPSQTGLDPITGAALGDATRHFGANAMKVISTGTASPVIFEYFMAGDRDIPGTDGLWMTASVWIKGVSGSAVVSLQTLINGSTGQVFRPITPTVGAWKQITQSFFVPAGTTYFHVTVSNDNVAGTYYVADLDIRVGFGAPMSAAPRVGGNASFLMAGANKITFGASVPSTFARAGDMHVNTAATTLEVPQLWVCTALGTPGTWYPVGYLTFDLGTPGSAKVPSWYTNTNYPNLQDHYVGYVNTADTTNFPGSGIGSVTGFRNSNSSYSGSWQMFKDRAGNGMWLRFGSAAIADTWTAWARILDSSMEIAGASQAATVMGNADAEIGGLPIGALYSQSEVQALRDRCEELADDVRNIHTLLHALRDAGISLDIWKGAA